MSPLKSYLPNRKGLSSNFQPSFFRGYVQLREVIRYFLNWKQFLFHGMCANLWGSIEGWSSVVLIKDGHCLASQVDISIPQKLLLDIVVDGYMDITAISPNFDHESWIYFISSQYGTTLVMDILDITSIWHIMTQFWWTNFSKYPTSHSPRSKCCAKPVAGATGLVDSMDRENISMEWAFQLTDCLTSHWIPLEEETDDTCIRKQGETSTNNLLLRGSVENFNSIFRTFDLKKVDLDWQIKLHRFFLTMALHAHHLKLYNTISPFCTHLF